jgi:hypothetical protein
MGAWLLALNKQICRSTVDGGAATVSRNLAKSLPKHRGEWEHCSSNNVIASLLSSPIRVRQPQATVKAHPNTPRRAFLGGQWCIL